MSHLQNQLQYPDCRRVSRRAETRRGHKLLLGCLLFLTCHAAYSQALHIDSTRFITGLRPGTLIEYSIATADKGILFVGFDNNNPGGIIPYFPLDTSGGGNVLIGKIDSNQHISWLKVYGGSQQDLAMSACQTADGGYAVLATTYSDNGDVTHAIGDTANPGNPNIWLLRIDSGGNLLWQNNYGSNFSDLAISIANTPDHGFIILGATDGSDHDVPFHYGDFFSLDWVVIKTDSLGNKQWSRDLGGTQDESENGSIISAFDGYYLVSSTSSTDHDCTDTAWHAGVNTGDDYHILKLDTTGNVLWDSSYGGTVQDEVNYAMFDTRDSTIIITGNTSSSNFMVTGFQGNTDMWVVKVNKNGTLVWQKTLGSINDETGTGLCNGPDGGYMVYGNTRVATLGTENLWLFVLDSAGNEVTNKIFGGMAAAGVVESPASIIPYLDGYVATGLSGAASFTDGTTYGNFTNGGPFICYIDYTPPSIIKVLETNSTIAAYPNPAQNTVAVTFPGNVTGNLIITNCIGQVYYNQPVHQIKYRDINVRSWAGGMYLIKWQGEDGCVLTTKFIKQ